MSLKSKRCSKVPPLIFNMTVFMKKTSIYFVCRWRQKSVAMVTTVT